MIELNGDHWQVVRVYPDSPMLVDRTGKRRLATTDPGGHVIYMSMAIADQDYESVLTHEVAHAAIVSYHLIDDIQEFIRPEYQVYAEEWICNFIADFGRIIFREVRREGNGNMELVTYFLNQLFRK